MSNRWQHSKKPDSNSNITCQGSITECYTKYFCHLVNVVYGLIEPNLRPEKIMSEPVVNCTNVLMSLLRIKLNLMKQFVKTLYSNSEDFEYLKGSFPK